MLGQDLLTLCAALMSARGILAARGLVGILVIWLVFGNKLVLAFTNEVSAPHPL